MIEKLNVGAITNANIFNVVRVYRHALKFEKRRVIFSVVARTASAISQGTAVITIVPLLGHVLGHDNPIARRVGAIGAHLGFESVIIPLVGLFIMLGIMSTLLRCLADNLADQLRFSIDGRLRNELLSAVSTISWPGFTQLRRGDLAKVINTDSARYADGAEKLVRAASLLLFAGILFTMALATSPFVVAALCPAFGIGLIGFRLIHRRIGQRSKVKAQAARASANAYAELINQWKFIKSAGLTKLFLNHAKLQHDKFVKQAMYISSSSHKVHSLFESWSIILIGSFLAFGVMDDSASIGKTIVVFGLFVRLLPQLFNSQRTYDMAKTHQYAAITWQQIRAQIKLFEQPHNGQVECRFEAALELRELGLCYSTKRHRTWAIRNLNITVEKLQCVAILGGSGAGKTTLLDLITGLLEPSEGQVLIDGTNLLNVNLDSWQRQISIVSQETPLFFGTVTENIALGEKNPDYDRIKTVAEMANAKDFISNLSDGFETNIGEGGIKLSGGQRQRLAIARALYKKPSLLILDEVTSALDATNESAITETITNLKGTVTMLIVTHRPCTAKMADKFIYLDCGRVQSIRSTFDES